MAEWNIRPGPLYLSSDLDGVLLPPSRLVEAQTKMWSMICNVRISTERQLAFFLFLILHGGYVRS
ncbi:hypothetical protein BDW42DRAFT_163010, partial [Aspergillus taichungensis]